MRSKEFREKIKLSWKIPEVRKRRIEGISKALKGGVQTPESNYKRCLTLLNFYQANPNVGGKKSIESIKWWEVHKDQRKRNAKLTKNTMEEKVLDILYNKGLLFEQMFDKDESVMIGNLLSMTKDELREMV